MNELSAHARSGEEPCVYVLDTNVLLHDPNSLFAFKNHDVVIPMTVIEEMDRFKKDQNEIGRNARSVSRHLDGLRSKGSLREGVQLPTGGTLRVDYDPESGGVELPITWGEPTNDNRILQTVMRLHRDFDGFVVFITRDTNMRLKSDVLGIPAEDYQNARIQVDEQYTGMIEVPVPVEVIDEIYANGFIGLSGFEEVYPQQIAMLTANDGSSKTAMARKDTRRDKMRLVGRHKEGVWGIFARNKEQLFAMELLLDDSISLVTINGVAGTGKTLLAIACALRKVADEQKFRRALVSRPIFPLGRDLGYLPGDLGEKLNPWMKPIFDNLDLLLATRNDASPSVGGHSGSGRGESSRSSEPNYQYLLDKKLIEVEPLTYIRGRSIPNQYLIVDEAQNLTPHEVKTILTRAGEGTKVVLTGDPNQIDNPYVDALSNGLTYTVERFKGSDIAGHITLRKGERSELAELAAQLL